MRFFPSFLTTPNYNPFLELIHFNRRPNPFAPLPFILFWLPKSQLLPHCASPFPYLHHTQPANPLPLPPSLTTHNPTVTPSISPWISHNLSPNTTSRICWLPYAVYHPASVRDAVSSCCAYGACFPPFQFQWGNTREGNE